MSAKPGQRGFIASLLADPEKKRKLMVNSIIAIQAREGITTTREQAEAAYDRTQQTRNSDSRVEQSAPSPKRRGAGQAAVQQPVLHGRLLDSTSTSTSGSETSPVIRRAERVHSVGGDERIVARITATLGEPVAFDGRYRDCIEPSLWHFKPEAR